MVFESILSFCYWPNGFWHDSVIAQHARWIQVYKNGLKAGLEHSMFISGRGHISYTSDKWKIHRGLVAQSQFGVPAMSQVACFATISEKGIRFWCNPQLGWIMRIHLQPRVWWLVFLPLHLRVISISVTKACVPGCLDWAFSAIISGYFSALFPSGSSGRANC